MIMPSGLKKFAIGSSCHGKHLLLILSILFKSTVMKV